VSSPRPGRDLVAYLKLLSRFDYFAFTSRIWQQERERVEGGLSGGMAATGTAASPGSGFALDSTNSSVASATQVTSSAAVRSGGGYFSGQRVNDGFYVSVTAANQILALVINPQTALVPVAGGPYSLNVVYLSPGFSVVGAQIPLQDPYAPDLARRNKQAQMATELKTMIQTAEAAAEAKIDQLMKQKMLEFGPISIGQTATAMSLDSSLEVKTPSVSIESEKPLEFWASSTTLESLKPQILSCGCERFLSVKSDGSPNIVTNFCDIHGRRSKQPWVVIPPSAIPTRA